MRAPRLIHLNGPTAVGKSTIATALVEDHPGTLLVDIDTLRVGLGGWRRDASSKQRARELGFALTRNHLAAGHDVVLPQLVVRRDVIERLAHLVRDVGAELVEVVLLAPATELRARLEAITAPSPHPRAEFSTAELVGQVERSIPALEELARHRPDAVIVPVAGLAPEAAVEAVRAALTEASDAGAAALGVADDRSEHGRPLGGGWEQRDLFERAGTVHRRAGAQSVAVLELLRHLERVGFAGAPRVVEPGLENGRELLTYVEGDIHDRPLWDEFALAEIGAMVRQLHDSTRTFPAAHHRWRDTFMRHLPADEVVVGHGDLGPWNIVSKDGRPVAFIDWDTAGPVGRTWDLASAAWLNVQLHDDDVAERQGLGDAASRGRHLRAFLDGYELPLGDRPSFIDRVAELAIHEARDEAVRAGVAHDSTAGVLENGYPILWAIAWRARSASWILDHREELRAAIC